jgi:hypothetical protein
MNEPSGREILKAAKKELLALHERPDSRKLWLTARVLAKRIRDRPGFHDLSRTRLEAVLMEHRGKPVGQRCIRNSKYPSGRTLEVLWGAIAQGRLEDIEVPPPTLARDWSNRPERERDAHGNELNEDDIHHERPTVFLSYNSSDLERAHEVVEILTERGHSVWFAETRIRPGEEINVAVQAALDLVGRHVVYLSWTALESLWVGNEFLFGAAQELEQFHVVRGDDREAMSRVIASTHHWAGGIGGIEVPPDATSREQVCQFHKTVEQQLSDGQRKIYVHPLPEGGLGGEPCLRPLSDFPVA